MTPSKLPTRQLDIDGPYVTGLGFGTSSFSQSDEVSDHYLSLLDQAYELGEWNWDTADVYGGGKSEEVIGKWFANNPEKRKDIFLATKFARKRSAEGQSIDPSPEYCKESCEKALKKLGVDCIDLWYAHRLDTIAPVEKTVQAMVELKDERKIKYFGLSECSAETLRRACKVHHIAAVQLEYSPWVLDIEDPKIDLMRTAKELGVALVAYSPLGKGMLTGTIRKREDFPKRSANRLASRLQGDNLDKNLAFVDQWTEWATQQGCTPGQLCLAWLLAQGEQVFPIPGTTKIERLKENLGALNVVISQEREDEMRKLCEEAKAYGSAVEGSKYNEYTFFVKSMR